MRTTTTTILSKASQSKVLQPFSRLCSLFSYLTFLHFTYLYSSRGKVGDFSTTKREPGVDFPRFAPFLPYRLVLSLIRHSSYLTVKCCTSDTSGVHSITYNVC